MGRLYITMQTAVPPKLRAGGAPLDCPGNVGQARKRLRPAAALSPERSRAKRGSEQPAAFTASAQKRQRQGRFTGLSPGPGSLENGSSAHSFSLHLYTGNCIVFRSICQYRNSRPARAAPPCGPGGKPAPSPGPGRRRQRFTPGSDARAAASRPKRSTACRTPKRAPPAPPRRPRTAPPPECGKRSSGR